MALPMDDRGGSRVAVEDLFATATGSGARPRKAPTRKDPAIAEQKRLIRAKVAEFAKAFDWSLKVTGSYASGASYQDVLGYLDDSGRKFTADSKSLHDAVKIALLEELEGYKVAPGITLMRQLAADVILERVIARFENLLRDVPIKRNATSYLAWKRKKYGETRPGIASGALLEAIRDKGRVKVT